MTNRGMALVEAKRKKIKRKNNVRLVKNTLPKIIVLPHQGTLSYTILESLGLEAI